MIVEPGKTYVRRVRARTRERDTLACQLRLGGALASMSLHPPGVPASSIVCVRRLRAPAPRTPSARRDDGRTAREWEQTVASSLARLASRASRPARGRVPDDAEAVLFTDLAELLACLAVDFCRGVAAGRWWWRSLLEVAADKQTLLLRAWLAAPEYVPSALDQLARSGDAATFARSLDARDARSVLLALTHAFALHELHAALEADGAIVRPPEILSLGRPAGPATSPDGVPASTNDDTPPPWRRHAPESRAAGLGVEQQTLLGIGLSLARAPRAVRAPAFARALRDWLRAPRETDPTASARGKPTSDATQSGGEATARLRAVESAAGAATSTDLEESKAERKQTDEDGAGTRSPVLDGAEYLTSTHGATSSSVGANADEPAGLSAGPSVAVVGRQQQGEYSSDEAREARAASPHAAPHTGSPDTAEPAPDAFPLPFEARVGTRLGGIFYLVNVGLFLELYGDFTAPLRPGIALPLWDFVALLARRLHGEEIEGDGVWALLARLAGREESAPPGSDFAAPSEWRVPPAWLKAFPERVACEWAAEGKRLRVRHPEGFFLIDVPLKTADAARQLADETSAYADAVNIEPRPRGRRATPGLLPAGALEEVTGIDEGVAAGSDGSVAVGDDDCGDDVGGGGEDVGGDALERWVGWLAAYVRARIGRAMGLGRADDPARVLCESGARVDVTATRVDVFFELKHLPLEVRMAGLDRDPGWVPAAGRFIAFHFE